VNRVEVNVRTFVCAAAASLLLVGAALAQSGYSVELDLQQQRAYLLQGRHLVLQSPISSGRYGHLTETGTFKVIEKERNHFSSMYGKIVDARGNTVVTDADADMKVPKGGKFIPAPMRYFMRFHGATGMHAGYLPGYPASHGCVRMPEELAIAFFDRVQIGTPVHVFGRTPRTREYYQYGPQPIQQGRPWLGRTNDPRIDPRYTPAYDPRFQQRYDPRYDAQYDPRYVDPWWR
jgi:lipoprotein-anchoring transpeptidase ErfK/SrfK